MNTDPKTRAATTWEMLQESLPGTFVARARGLLGNDFVLLGADGTEHGYLKILGDRKAKFTVGGAEVLVNRAPDLRYTMTSGNETLCAGPLGASSDELEVRCGEETYAASISLFRNKAVARRDTGDETARLSGNLTGRSYEVAADLDDPCALPVAMLLIYHTALGRRRAYRTAR